MSADPRAALVVLQAALERHLEACVNRHGEDDPAVASAYEHLVDAFEAYDGALYEATGEMTPLDIYDEDEDSDDDSDDDVYDDDDLDDDEDESDEDEDESDEDDDDVDHEGLDDHDDEDGDSDHVYLGLDGLDFDEPDAADVTR